MAGTWVVMIVLKAVLGHNPEAAEKELEDAKKSTQESGENVPDIEILAKVVGTRSGHTRLVGRKLKRVSSSSLPTSSSSIYYSASKTYTQEEVNQIVDEKTKSMKKSLRKKFAASVNKKFENLLTQLAEKGISWDKVGEEDEEYEESDDEGTEDEDDGMENEDENDHAK